MQSRTKTFLRMSLLLLGILIGGSSFLLWSRMATSANNLVDMAVPFSPSGWEWKNEEHWAIDQMVKDIAEMIFFAAKEDTSKVLVKTVPVGVRVYSVTITSPHFAKPYESRLELQEFLWNPETFSPMVKDLLRLLDIKPTATPATGILQTLLTPRASEIEKAQAEVSSTLTTSPTSAGAHAQAALVLGVLGLFDQAGAFQDHRFILCRMVSHLALANGLRDADATPEGELARVGLLILMGRKSQAAREIADFRTDPVIPPAWANALFMFASGDWRQVKDPTKVSLAEALASFKGRSYHQGADHGANWIMDSGRNDVPLAYVARITMLGNDYSVSMAGLLAPPSVEWDLVDLQEVNRLRKRESLSSDLKICGALSAHPSRAWNPATQNLEVIGWGLWAQHFQAVLLDDMMQTINYHYNMIGSKPDTLEYIDILERRFSNLEQFPVLQKRYASIRPEVYKNAILKAAYFTQQHPELLSDCNWTALNHVVGTNPLPKALPRYQDWLAVMMPFGTTYNWTHRVWEMTEHTNMTLAEITQFHQWDPFNLSIIGFYLYTRFPDGNYTPEVVEMVCAATRDFNRLHYLERLRGAYPDHSPEELAVLREITEIDKEWRFTLADELVHQKREAEASQVYLKAFQETKNRIMASNGATWEVLYLYRTKQATQAEQIAQECAAVYSYRGLQTLALLREAQGRLSEAQREYAKIAERYDDAYVLPAFHYRNRLKSSECQRAWDQECKKLFPKGLQKFDAIQATAPPRHGLVLQDDSAYLRHRGIARDAILVALDGFNVENLEQYSLIRAFEWADGMRLMVYQGGKYTTITSDFHNRSLGVNLITYQPQAGVKQ